MPEDAVGGTMMLFPAPDARNNPHYPNTTHQPTPPKPTPQHPTPSHPTPYHSTPRRDCTTQHITTPHRTTPHNNTTHHTTTHLHTTPHHTTQAARWRGHCRSYACTSKRSEKGYSGSSWSKDGRQGGDDQVFPAPPLSAWIHTLTHSAHTTHTAPPVYLYPWVDIPAIAFW